MRIAMLTSVGYPATEGIGVYSFELARRLRALGHATTLLTRGRGLGTYEEHVGDVPVVMLPFVPVYPLHVHLHSLFANRYLAAHRRDFDLVHAHSPLPAIPARNWPIVTTLHSCVADDGKQTPISDAYSLLIRLQTPFSARLERRLLRRSRSVAVVNPMLADRTAELAGSATRISVVMNAVDTNLFRPGSADPSAGRRTVLYVGRLAPGKGMDELFRAWPSIVAAHPDARLRIIGSGPSERRARHNAAGLGLDGTIEFDGSISREERPRLAAAYRSATVVVQPSHHEGVSTTLLEGMASGLPVVATDVGGHRRVITSGHDGILVPPRDATALAAAVVRILTNAQDALRMGLNARTRVEQAFGWENLTRKYVDCYEEALGIG